MKGSRIRRNMAAGRQIVGRRERTKKKGFERIMEKERATTECDTLNDSEM